MAFSGIRYLQKPSREPLRLHQQLPHRPEGRDHRRGDASDPAGRRRRRTHNNHQSKTSHGDRLL